MWSGKYNKAEDLKKIVSKQQDKDSKAAFGPQPDEPITYPEIVFVPSGNPPVVDLGAPPYSLELANRRRNQFLTQQHSISDKMELYTSSTKGKLPELK